MPSVPTAPPSSRSPQRIQDALTAFVGRERERAELVGAFDHAVGGSGRLVLLAGDLGVGKTRLADELTIQAAARGAVVAWGRCWEGGGAPAYWPWMQIIRTCAGGLDAAARAALIASCAPYLTALVPELGPPAEVSDARPLSTGFASTNPGPEESDRFRLFDAVSRFFAHVSRERPLVIVFDDAHAADAASLLMLRFLARELRPLRLLLIVTYRETEAQLDPHKAELVAEIGREGTTLTLTGLTEADVHQFLEASTGQPPDHATVAALHRTTEGNPFFLSEIVRLLAAEGRSPQRGAGGLADFRIPDRVRVAIRRRVRLVSGAARAALNVAAVAGHTFDAAVIAAAAEAPLEQLTAALEEAEARSIIHGVPDAAGRYRFNHVLISETLYHDLPKPARRQLHLRIAGIIEDTHRTDLAPHYSALAHHFSAALPAGPADKAVEYSRRGAEAAQAVFAYEEAADLYRLAIDASELTQSIDERARCEMLLSLGEALYGTGLFNRARDAFERAADCARRLGSAEHVARAALGFGMPPTTPYVVDTALVHLLEEALGALPDSDTALRAMVMARLASELYWSDARARGGDLSRRAVETARRLGDRLTLVYSLFARHVAAWSVDNLEERLAIATEIAALASDAQSASWPTRIWELRASYLRFDDLLELGDVAGVDQEIEQYARLAAELRHQLGYEELVRATRALMDGRLAQAEEMAERALEVAGELERRQRPFRQAVGSLRLILRREQGRIDEIEPLFASARARAPQSALVRCSLALCHIELGQRAEAVAEFEQVAAADLAALPRDAAWMATMVLLAEVCAALGDTDRALTLYRLLLPYASRNATLDVHACYGSVALYLGILATTAADLDRAAEHFEAALRFNLKMGASLWVAHTRYRYAGMLLARGRSGDRERAAELAALASASAESLGLTSLGRRIRALGRTDVVGAGQADGTVIPVTILFTDVRDSTGLTERLGDLRAQELLHAHNTIVREQVAAHRGSEVKSMGDGFMIAFPSARRALLCAIAIQRALAAHNRRQPDAPIHVSMGVHSGEAIKESGDFFGKTVILAARIGAHARGGEILVSTTCRELAASAGDLRFDEGHEIEFKGLAGSYRVHAVRWEDGGAAPGVSAPERSGR